MIDIHSHLLPGVDDGSPSLDVSVPVLERFAADGVTVLVCTPHLNASQAATAPYTEYLNILTELRRAAPELCLGGSRALLVEFTRGGIPRGASTELRRIARSGRTPILAHPERYFGCTLELVREWREVGVVIQTDASVLMGRGLPGGLARSLLSHGLIDILASDNHGDHRSLAFARDWLGERGGEAQVELLTRVNAGRVLSDEDPLPVPPLRSGMLTRIRRLFGA